MASYVRIVIACAVVLSACAGIGFWIENHTTTATSQDQIVVQARLELERRNFAAVASLIDELLPGTTHWTSGQIVAGDAAMRAGDYNAAIRRFQCVPQDGSRESRIATRSLGEVLRETGRLSDAERAYREVLKYSPDDTLAHERLAFLYGVTGRPWESLPHFRQLLIQGAVGIYELVLMADVERPMEPGDYLKTCLSRAPDDDAVQLGLAAQASAEGQPTEALTHARRVIENRPDWLSAQALLGELLLAMNDPAIADWHRQLLDGTETSPGIWYVRGLAARRTGDLSGAARCFWETMRLAPSHRRASYQLGQVLVALDDPAAAEFTKRAALLFELTHNLDLVLRSEHRDPKSAQRVPEILEEIGRLREAMTWAALAAQQFPGEQWPLEVIQRIGRNLMDETPMTIPSADLARVHDLTHYAVPQKAGNALPEMPLAGSDEPSAAAVRFVEEQNTGIAFRYYNSPDPSTPGARMFESNGGGVAVIDFDLDGTPDLYFTQGAEWQHGTPLPLDDVGQFKDVLFRQRDGRFFPVTEDTNLTDNEFGQGCAAGDIDNDGFPDLYVANIGRNRLWRNNGDGTFLDLTDVRGFDDDRWTASCVIIDLNADGNPDLFDVNYLAGDDVYERLCEQHACSPSLSGGSPDHVYISRGVGTFNSIPDVTSAAEAKGFGVVAVAIEEKSRPNLFVVNDQVANLLLSAQPTNAVDTVSVVNNGFASGLAFNEDGLAMGCMGIAADDADGNGLMDFFVTNFLDESNTLYLQDAPGLFVDQTNAAGLRAASIPLVGWGTQFLDADLDGNPDIVLVNGHVDDYRDVGGQYMMRPQFFQNRGHAKFVERFGTDIGEYFDQERLGRGLARLDWNRDGRMDFVVSNIGDPVSLVSNVSTSVGHHLNVRLHATTTARDGIGTVVVVRAGSRTWTRQLTAGDGFMASNERMLQFGVGAAASISDVTIGWPSGSTTIIRNPPLDATIEAVEQRRVADSWPTANPESRQLIDIDIQAETLHDLE